MRGSTPFQGDHLFPPYVLYTALIASQQGDAVTHCNISPPSRLIIWTKITREAGGWRDYSLKTMKRSLYHSGSLNITFILSILLSAVILDLTLNPTFV